MSPAALEIVRFVARSAKVRPEDLLGQARRRELSAPRHIAMYLVYTRVMPSYPRLGEWFARHHTTVLYGVRKIAEWRATREKFAARLASLEAGLDLCGTSLGPSAVVERALRDARKKLAARAGGAYIEPVRLLQS